MHTLTLKAWDIFNNSSVAEINFKVIDGTTPAIEKVKCYPNPLNKSTSNLTFTFEHNINNEQLDVTIWIYDMAGMLVSKLYSNIQPAGYTSGPIVWDNSSASGSLPSKGMYLYRITINTKNGEVQSDAKKLIIVE
jgi:flagellar hook assembly protein FlgD